MKNPEQVRSFLVEANNAGYGNPNVKIEKAEDGGHIINFTGDAFNFRDYFYGGHPYAGQEVVYEDGKPVWALQYRGWVHDTEMTPGEVYDFLKKALLRAPAEYPYRGPVEFSEGNMTYRNSWQGEFENVHGEEVILDGEREIYKGLYFGGEVDV